MRRRTLTRRWPLGLAAAAVAVAMATAGTGAAHAAAGGTSVTRAAGAAIGAGSAARGGYGHAAVVTPAELRARVAAHPARLVVPTISAHGGVETAVSPDIAGGNGNTEPSDIVQVIYTVPDPARPGTVDYQFCAGAPIAPNKIVTAASCVAGLDYAEHGLVWGGSDQNVIAALQSGSTDIAGEGMPVVRQWVDPDYSASATGLARDDVAVLTLAGPFGEGVDVVPDTPAPATDHSDYAAGAHAWVDGWGATAPGKPADDAPVTAAALVESPDSGCEAAYTGYVAGAMTCFGEDPAAGASNVALCAGDSGDPLRTTSGVLIGIAATGTTTCQAGAPIAFTRLSSRYGVLADFAQSDSLVDANGAITGLGGMMARDAGGSLWDYSGNGTGGVDGRAASWFAASGENLLVRIDLGRSGATGLLARSPAGLLEYAGADVNGNGFVDDVGHGWEIYTAMAAAGNVGGASYPDLVARDAAGRLWLYLGNSVDSFAARSEIGAGWNVYNSIVGGGDFNGDGYGDLIARDKSGDLWYYQGTGDWRAPFKARVEIGHGFQTYDAMVVVDDFTGDGRAALLGRDSSGGLWAYRGTGSSATPLPARVKIGHGFQMYTSLF